MKYKIIVDKQSRTNPSEEKREYEVDIEELRFKGDVYDSLVITKDEDYVMRRLELTDFYVLKELETPIKEPLENINIELFEGDNYIYLIDMTGNKFYAEYLIKNDFSEKLQLIRKNRGLTLEELAEKLSVSRQAVAKWKSGQVYPEITNLIQISNLLDAGSAEVFCTILRWCFPGLFPENRCEITLAGKRQGSRNYRDRIIGMAKHILGGLYSFALYIGTDRNSHLFCEQAT